MGSRKIIMGILVLVLLGAGAWWALADKDSQEVNASALGNAPPPPTVPPLPTLPVEGTRKNESVASPDKPPQDAVQAEDKTTTEKFALLFAGRANPDPALSKELEREVLYALDASVDHARFDVESVICREYMCQIVSFDRMMLPVDPRSLDPHQGWGSILKKVLFELKDTDMQNARTGARISLPRVRQIEYRHTGGGVVSYIEFGSEEP